MKVPKHIAVIMDGNGRWAKKRGLSRTAGHKKGIERIKEVVRAAKELGVKILTVFAFSTENWNRPKREIDFLFSNFDRFLDEYRDELVKEGIRLRIIGRKTKLNKTTLEKIKDIESLTKNNRSFFFNIAVDYGGRWDIVNATNQIIADQINKKLPAANIDETTFRRYLALGEDTEPDLLIRTSGEQRISNFLLWNLAYSEFYFTNTTWPDFDKRQLERAISTYSGRERRYGEINE